MKVHLILAFFLLLIACEKSGYDAPEEQADSVLGEVGSKKLENHIQLIRGASLGELSKIHRQGADMGSGAYTCYKYDPNENAYQIIVLEVWGDNQQYPYFFIHLKVH